jgi:hypothetical protein
MRTLLLRCAPRALAGCGQAFLTVDDSVPGEGAIANRNALDPFLRINGYRRVAKGGQRTGGHAHPGNEHSLGVKMRWDVQDKGAFTTTFRTGLLGHGTHSQCAAPGQRPQIRHPLFPA